MSKIRDTDYLTLSTRVRAMETRLVTRERMERMLDARTDDEAAKVLTECGYEELPALGFTPVKGSGEGMDVSGFISLMTEYGIIRHGRIQPGCHQQTVGHDESVDQNDHMQLSRLQHAPHGHSHLITAKVTDYIRRRTIADVIVPRSLQHFILMTYTVLIQSAPGANACIQRNMRERMHPKR